MGVLFARLASILVSDVRLGISHCAQSSSLSHNVGAPTQTEAVTSILAYVPRMWQKDTSLA